MRPESGEAWVRGVVVVEGYEAVAWRVGGVLVEVEGGDVEVGEADAGLEEWEEGDGVGLRVVVGLEVDHDAWEVGALLASGY